MTDILRQKLLDAFAAEHVVVIDNSASHAGHAGMPAGVIPVGTHLEMVIVSQRFDGLPLLDRHRLVHQLLVPERENGLHALELKTWTPAEWAVREQPACS